MNTIMLKEDKKTTLVRNRYIYIYCPGIKLLPSKGNSQKMRVKINTVQIKIKIKMPFPFPHPLPPMHAEFVESMFNAYLSLGGVYPAISLFFPFSAVTAII